MGDSQQLEGKTLAEVVAQAQAGLATDANLQAHLSDTNNPHNVTKAQVGLGNVENKSVAEILASDAETMLATDKSQRVATTQSVTTSWLTTSTSKMATLLMGAPSNH